MQPSEVFYWALVSFRPSVIQIVPSIIFLFVQGNTAPFARVKDEEHPKNLTSHNNAFHCIAPFYIDVNLNE